MDNDEQKSKRINEKRAIEMLAEQKAYQEEQRRKKLLNSIYIGATVFSALVLFIVFSSGKFSFLMGSIGINVSNEETGIYVDCGKRENKKSVYCQPKESASEATWKDLSTSGRGKTVPFNLH